jgi:hypothetical protein
VAAILPPERLRVLHLLRVVHEERERESPHDCTDRDDAFERTHVPRPLNPVATYWHRLVGKAAAAASCPEECATNFSRCMSVMARQSVNAN